MYLGPDCLCEDWFQIVKTCIKDEAIAMIAENNYWLMLFDEWVGDYASWGQWDDIEKAREIGKKSAGYRIIQGRLIEQEIFEEDDYV